MPLKDYSDNEAVRPRGQDLVSTNTNFVPIRQRNAYNKNAVSSLRASISFFCFPWLSCFWGYLFERSEFLIATSPKKNLYFVRVFD